MSSVPGPRIAAQYVTAADGRAYYIGTDRYGDTYTGRIYDLSGALARAWRRLDAWRMRAYRGWRGALDGTNESEAGK